MALIPNITKIRILFVLALTFSILSKSQATTYYAVCSCNWNGAATWSTTPGGAGGSLPGLSNGDVIVISDFTVTITSTFTIAQKITINLISNSSSISTVLAFQTGKKMILSDAGSVINLSKNNSGYLDPQIDPGGGGGSSNFIDIGGNQVWKASDGVISGIGQLNVNSTGGSLPVTLDSFGAVAGYEKVNLNWSTASELNFNYFSIERSTDGKDFHEIDRAKGHGTTNEAHRYSYEDTDPFIGRSYYRLTSIDFDGYQETFKVVSVIYRGGKKFQISPNPSDGSSIGLNFNFENDADAQVTIYDNLGSAIGSYHVLGNGSINFENSLKSGIYLAKYTSATFTKTERFLVK